jgi:hypothetical protein
VRFVLCVCMIRVRVICIMRELSRSMPLSSRINLCKSKGRSLFYYQDDDGLWVIKARLAAKEGGLLVKLIKALGEQIMEGVSSRDISARDCVDENSRLKDSEGCSDESIPTESSFVPDPLINFPQSWAYALVMIAESFLANDGLLLVLLVRKVLSVVG